MTATANTVSPQSKKSNRTAVRVREVALTRSREQGAVTHAAIAEELGISVSTVQRALRHLREHGEIVWEIRPNELKNALRYSVLGEEVTDRSEVGVSSETPVRSDRSKPVGLKGNDLREDVLVGREEDSIDSSLHTNTNRRTSTSRPRRPSILDGRITSLVEEFERYVAPRSPRAITSKRRQAWSIAAEHLLFGDKRSLDQVRQILAWIFDQQQGVLPSWFSFKWRNDKEFKVTRLYQVVEHWDDLVEAMSGTPPEVAGEADELARTMASVSDEAKSPGSKVDNFTVASREEIDDQVNQLITAFAEFKRLPLDRLDDWNRNNWTKTFQIMLRADRRPFAELHDVISHLGDRLLGLLIDVPRYHSPFRVREEYNQLMGCIAVAKQIAEEEATRRPQSHPVSETSTRRWEMEDMDYLPPAKENSTCTSESSDMGDPANIEARRRRYEERAAKNRLRTPR